MDKLELISSPIPFVLAEAKHGVSALVVVGVDAEPVDWGNIAPHPELAAFDHLCTCGAARGEHLVEPPHRAVGSACSGFTRVPFAFAKTAGAP